MGGRTGQVLGEVTLQLPAAIEFDVVSLQEAVDHRGQRIESFDIEIWDGAKWEGRKYDRGTDDGRLQTVAAVRVAR